MMYLSYAIVWGLSESILARSLYSIHHWFLYRTLSHADYTHLSIVMGILYGLFAIIDLGLFDSIGPWFTRYTASKRHFAHYFLPHLFFSWFPLALAYFIMFHRLASFSYMYLLIGLAEHTKRQLRLFLNVAGYARLVALAEGFSYLCYVFIVWSLFFLHGVHTFYYLFLALAFTSVGGVLVLFLALAHFYHTLDADAPIAISWRSLLLQRGSCALSNLMTANGLHTIVLPLLARSYATNAALLSCTNAIVSAMSTIIYKIITVAGTISFNPTSPRLRRAPPASAPTPTNTDPSSPPSIGYGVTGTPIRSVLSLRSMLCIVASVWAIILVSASFLCYWFCCPITGYLLISLGIYAAHSIQHTTKLALDAQFKSHTFSIIITLSSLCTHLLFYLWLAHYLPVMLVAPAIVIITLATLSITYTRARASVPHFLPAHHSTHDRPTSPQSPHDAPHLPT